MAEIGNKLICDEHGPNDLVETIREYVDTGFAHVVIDQIGSNQAEFVEFYEDEVLPAIE